MAYPRAGVSVVRRVRGVIVDLFAGMGTKTAAWLQVGNAIPPPLAKAILAQLVPAQEAAA